MERLIRQGQALDPQRGIRTTAREMATLLRLIWRGEAGPAAACAQVRQLMSQQVTRQRLALGFPRRGVQLAAKSGSLLGAVRNEAGVITMPDGRRYAAAVFTRENQPGAGRARDQRRHRGRGGAGGRAAARPVTPDL